MGHPTNVETVQKHYYYYNLQANLVNLYFIISDSLHTRGGKNGVSGVVSDLLLPTPFAASKPLMYAWCVVTCFSFTILLQNTTKRVI